MEDTPRVSLTANSMFYFNKLKDDKQQRYRHILSLCAAFHFTANLGKLYWHYNVGPEACVPPDFLAFMLSIAARFCWIFLFRKPDSYIGFKRPSREYKVAVLCTAIATTLPTAYVHVWAIKAAQDKSTIVNAGLVNAIIAIVLLVPLTGLMWWMVWRFLLRETGGDADFEPTVMKSRDRDVERRRGAVTAPIAPYSDEPPQPALNEATLGGHLALAYEEQRRRAVPIPVGQQSQGRSEMDTPTDHTVGETQGQEPALRANTPASPANNQVVPEPTRCPTTARYEYMSENHSGGHSWFFDPLIPLILTVYTTVTMVLQLVLIHMDRSYRHRAPSPTIKKSLFLPLGAYLLAFYAAKHRLRVSQFLRIESPFPGAWEKMIHNGGYYCRGYRNLENGDITQTDPRLRSFPPGAYRDPSLLRKREYLEAYNATAGSCDSYWGHSGRAAIVQFRLSPSILRLGFLALSLLIVLIGWVRTVFYNVINPFEELLKHGKELTFEDIVIIFRILKLWQVLIYGTLGLVLGCIVYALLGMLMLLILWVKAVLNLSEKNNADEQPQGDQGLVEGAHEGRIRLE